MKYLLSVAVVLLVSIEARTCEMSDVLKLDRDYKQYAKLDYGTRKWRLFYESFKYAQKRKCIDASVAEGFSEQFILGLLQDWKNIASLLNYMQRDSSFKDRIIDLVGNELTKKQVETIQINASRCPEKYRNVCREISKRVKVK